MKLIYLIVPIILIYIAYKTMETEYNDRNFPFGTDKEKNMKYTKGKKGEEYGVNTFWGKPHNKDQIQEIIDKIQWLSHGCQRDILWRNACVASIVFAIIIVICIDPSFFVKPVYLFFIVFSLFIVCYFSLTYYIRHFLDRRVSFIDTHIRKLKSELNISHKNSINENPIL